MAGKSIDKAFDEIIKDCQSIAVEAVKNAAKNTQKDILKEANNYLQKYYSNYTPEMYKRTYRLRRAVIPYWADKTNKNGVSIEVGVQYKSSALTGAYKSNSKWHQSGNSWKPVIQPVDFSSNNGIPEPDWILENFLEGEHGGAQQDKESTNSLMRDFFETRLPNHIEQYINQALFDAFVNRL